MCIRDRAYTLYIPEFIESQLTRSTFFEEAYVDPRSITLTFPEEKRNLVYIYLESMESTYLSKELGGNQEENLLPNLSELALANLNFSHTDTLGGARQVTGTSWTIAAMVSQTTGVPPVSYTHLNDTLPWEFTETTGEATTTLSVSPPETTTGTAGTSAAGTVSYTHLDVYKRQR